MTAIDASRRTAGAEDVSERVLRLVEYLSACDAQNNRPTRNIADHGWFHLDEAALPDVAGVRLTPGDPVWLSVDFVAPPAPPTVSPSVADLLPSSDGSNAQRGPAVGSSNRPTGSSDLYRDLFEQWERLRTDRDAVELVWGLGRFRRSSPNGPGSVDHPVLTIPIELEVDDQSRLISARPAGTLSVETLFLADIEVDDDNGLRALQASVAERVDAIDPWDPAWLTRFIRRFAQLVDPDGGMVGEVDDRLGVALVDPSWTLFLRPRRPDHQSFLDELRELYEAGATPPDPLQALVADSSLALTEAEPAPLPGPTRDSERLLLPLASNEEQRRIVTLAQQQVGVTVHGPPGTGKSHTIANIISHHVAHGRRVLVVAEKEQALRALADKVPEEVRPLTVSVLGADEVGRRRLESSIRHIRNGITAIDRDDAEGCIARLERELDTIDQDIAVAADKLTSVRRSELTTLPGQWQAGTDPTPATAAQWVAEHAERLGYIPDRVSPTAPPPLDPGEFGRFIELVARIGVERAVRAAEVLPELPRLPTGTQLGEHLDRLRLATARVESIQPGVTDWSQLDMTDDQTVVSILYSLRVELDWLAGTADRWEQRLRDQIRDPAMVEGWRSFLTDCLATREELLQRRQVLEAYNIEVPDQPEPDLGRDLMDAAERLRDRGKLGLFAGDARRALSVCRIDGQEPATANDIELCLSKLSLNESRRRLSAEWTNAMGRVDGPGIEESVPEDALAEPLTRLAATMEEPNRLAGIAERLRVVGISSPDRPTSDDLRRLIDLVELLPHRRRQRAGQRQLRDLQAYLRRGADQADASPLWSQMAEAFDRRDTGAWDRSWVEVSQLRELAPQADELRRLHQRLHEVAPTWTNLILADPSAAGSPGDLEEAWQWRQLRSWLSDVADSGDPATFLHELDELGTDRQRTVTGLVAAMAWLHLADNVGDRECHASNEAKDIVPVWIMPIHRALASFRLTAEPRFDVLIIDGASQLGLQTLPLLSLARSVIVVGDDKQTTADNVGLDRQAILDLLDDHLAVVPGYQTLSDPDASLYDLALQKFPDVVRLTEHFRSLPPIIEFSNLHAYRGEIVALRDRLPHPGWSALGALHVLDGQCVGDLNEPEALAVVDLVAELCEDPDYDSATFGVVSLLGPSQAKLIWDRLYERVGPQVMIDRAIRSGEAANFQGDERDVMIISTVVAPGPTNPDLGIRAMTGKAAERRINVAASRARDQMWVVHSAEPDRFPPGDLRAELIRHCRNPGPSTIDLDHLDERCESAFERDVLRCIIERGYRMVKVQHTVGRYRVDIVVEGPEGRLAIECDGDRWHDEDAWHQDRARQTVLERAGWTFERIRASSFYLDHVQALQPLWHRLDELGIPLGDEWIAEPPRTTVRTVGLAPTPDPADPTDGDVGLARADGEPVDGDYESDKEHGPVDGGNGNGNGTRNDDVSVVHQDVAPYVTWTTRPLAKLSAANEAEIVATLVEIVSAQGPMHLGDAYRVYVKATGGSKIGRVMRHALDGAVDKALAGGGLAQVIDGIEDRDGKTLFVAGQPAVVVRERGSRNLEQIPRSELRTLLGTLGEAVGSDEWRRAALDAVGLRRMTAKVSTRLDEAMAYSWSVPGQIPIDPGRT